MQGAWWLRALWLAALVVAGSPAAAHLMPAQQGTVNLDGDSAYLVVSLPVSALGGDANGDGLVTVPELEAHYSAMQRRVAQGLRLWNGDEQGQAALVQLLVDAEMRQGEASRHLVAMVRVKFASQLSPRTPVRMETDLFGSAADETQLTLRAHRGDETEPVLLSSLRPSHVFFQTASQKLQASVWMGAEHILLGFDHLLFLLTVLVVGAGWRYWVLVVTSFTIAHSITLALGALGWARLPASIAEPLIAASIVAVAWDNLRRPHVRPAQRAAVVFVCGLIHGLGFARALAEIGGGRVSWVQLAGFNTGVELGQLAFLAIALGAVATLRRLRPGLTAEAVTRGVSWSAAAIGSALLVHLLVTEFA